MWEGESRIYFIATYAPWAAGRCTKECLVDAVACCMVTAVAGCGHAKTVAVSGTHPLNRCNHFIAAVPMADGMPEVVDSIEALYSSMGMALVGTVVDGDCGIDVACQMQGLLQRADQRALVREELVMHKTFIKYNSHESTHTNAHMYRSKPVSLAHLLSSMSPRRSAYT